MKKITNPKICTFDVYEGFKNTRFFEPIIFRFCPPTFYAPQLCRQALLRRVLAMVILSVCLSVRPSRPGTDSMSGEIETPGLHRIMA